jgi:hypothetical protein
MTPSMMDVYADYDAWWIHFQFMALQANWPLGDRESYREYYDDGDLPQEALATEMSYAEEDEDF